VVGDKAPVGATIEPFVASSGPPADAVDLNHTASQVEALALVNENYASADTLLPIRIDNGVLLVACADPNDQAGLRELQVLTRHPWKRCSRPGRTSSTRSPSAPAYEEVTLVISGQDPVLNLRGERNVKFPMTQVGVIGCGHCGPQLTRNFAAMANAQLLDHPEQQCPVTVKR
jgi:Type II secretion system (T2SS), protein E, N-terminal domain